MRGSGGKNWVVAAVLDFFLGGIGIHRMYLGSSNLMWLYYGITCCGIFGVVPLIDFIVLIVDGVNNNIVAIPITSCGCNSPAFKSFTKIRHK